MPRDDGRMTETCCGNNIRRGEEELLRSRTHNCFVKKIYVSKHFYFNMIGVHPACVFTMLDIL
jgi:hypothetical protein